MPNVDCVGKCVCFGNCNTGDISEVVNNNPVCKKHDVPMHAYMNSEWTCDICEDLNNQ